MNNYFICPNCQKYEPSWGDVCMKCFIKRNIETKKEAQKEKEKEKEKGEFKKCRSCEEYRDVGDFNLHSLICCSCAGGRKFLNVYEKNPLPYS
jgi:hypothetical protein